MKSYTVQFGSGNPQGFTGLAPTFLTFYNLATGTTNAPPSIAETIAGKTGIYTFQYGTTQPISFLLDAATTSPGPNGRYVAGQLDPSDRADEYGNTLIAYGLTTISMLTAIGLSMGTFGGSLGALGLLIGDTSSSYGSTSIDPTTVFGFLKRAQEISEGNETYTKSTGYLDYYPRAASTLLRQKLISDTTSETTKT